MFARSLMKSLIAVTLGFGAVSAAWAVPIGSTFTYQGRLTNSGTSLNGTVPMSFRLMDAATGGSQVGNSFNFANVPVNQGLFTVALNFGPLFDGTALWLEVTVNGTTLSPRQPLNATPLAQWAAACPGSNLWQQSGPDISNATGGNVGVGTSSPSSRLDVIGNTPFPHLRVASYDDSFTPYGAFMSLDATANTGGKNYLVFATGGAAGEGNGKLVFQDYTDSRNIMTLTSGGGIGIGTTDPAARLHVVAGSEHAATFESPNATATRIEIDNTSGDGYSYELTCTGSSNGNGAGKFFIRDVIQNVIRLTIDPAGRVGIGRQPSANKLEVEGDASKTTASGWAANSDARIKTNVETISSALDTLDRVRLVSFDYTDEYRAVHPGIDGRRYLNVIAQEFAQVFPNHVKGSGERLSNGEEILQVDTYPLTIYSAAAVQELHTLLNAQAAQLAQKDAEISALQARLDKIEARLVGTK